MPELPLFYFRIEPQWRNNVREPILPPRMLLIKHGRSKYVSVELNEPQLLQIIKDAVTTLETMRRGRNATQPQSLPESGEET